MAHHTVINAHKGTINSKPLSREVVENQSIFEGLNFLFLSSV
jgi:hypothetical protein